MLSVQPAVHAASRHSSEEFPRNSSRRRRQAVGLCSCSPRPRRRLSGRKVRAHRRQMVSARSATQLALLDQLRPLGGRRRNVGDTRYAECSVFQLPCVQLNFCQIKFHLKSDLFHHVFLVYQVNSTDDSCCSTVFCCYLTVHCYQ